MAMLVLMIVLAVGVTSTFAWYIYQTYSHTTDVHMAVGAGASLQISNAYDGDYGSSAVMEAFTGTLNPVSTNKITGGFQKVYGFTNGQENQPMLVASLFGAGEAFDYYQTTLFVKTNGSESMVYLADIGYEDSDPDNPISTAIRIGFVTHKPGENQPEDGEYIFEINKEDNPEGEYNTATGEEGYVLDCMKTDGTTIPMENLYSSANFCEYDKMTGKVSLKSGSIPLFQVSGTGDGEFGKPVQVDVYIWLEGCDKDCTNNLCATTLRKIALSFACTTD